MNTNAAERLAAAIVERGCNRLFTLMGAGNLWLIHYLTTQHDVPVHHLRHENGAVGAADGLARATGELAWCTVTQGPGFTNTITALLTAHHGRVPLIAIVSDTTNLDPYKYPFAGGVQALAPEKLLDPLGIAVVRANGSDAAVKLGEAVQRAREESRPVVFVIPAGLDKVEVSEPTEDEAENFGPPVSTTMDAADAAGTVTATASEDLRSAVAILCAAKRPLIVVGLGVVHSGAAAEVLELAERLDCRISTTVPASGALGEHPAVIGPFGGFSIGRTEQLIEESDALMVVGASLNLFQTRKGAFLRERNLVRIDTAPGPVPAAASSEARTVTITADARVGLRAMLFELNGDTTCSSALASFPPEPVRRDVSIPGALDPRSLCREFDAVLPRRRRVFVDNGHFGAFPILYMTHRDPRSLIWMPDFGAVGSSLAASFASAVEQPEIQSVLFIGDCGLYMTLGDLETAVRERTPLVVVCMNDGAAGSEMVHMQDWGVPTNEADFGYNDIAALAAGMGAKSVSIHELGRLGGAFESWDRTGPLVLDCHLSREVRSPIYAHA